jgi:aspartyl-tRNA(Asn)/glutamyl-tRNA(Gln) amidotransferase subunit C
MEIRDVESLASLAKIDLSEEEKEKILKDMDSILDYVKQIESVQVPDTDTEIINFNSWREDEIKKQDFSFDSIVEQFPDEKNGFIKVKKIL